MHQEIQYCTASDGVRLAYSKIGTGTPVVRTPHWFAHLEHDLKGPIYRHQILGLAHRHTLLRYDGRGIGLSQRQVADTSFNRLVEDLKRWSIVPASKDLSCSACPKVAQPSHRLC